MSHRNRRVAEAARLHRVEERRIRRQTLLEGPHLLAEAVRAGVPLVEIFALAEDVHSHDAAQFAEVELVVVGEEALRRLSSTRNPQSPVTVIQIPTSWLDPAKSLLVAWQISDPGNLGTMIRTAAAFGLDFGTMAGSTDPWSPKVLRAASGGHFQTGIAALDDLSVLDAIKVAAVPSGGGPVGSLPEGRLALLIGSEAHGLPVAVIAGADASVTIPTTGPTESLNAAVAAAILAYEVSMRPK